MPCIIIVVAGIKFPPTAASNQSTRTAPSGRVTTTSANWGESTKQKVCSAGVKEDRDVFTNSTSISVLSLSQKVVLSIREAVPLNRATL